MSPDFSSAARGGLVALLAALLGAGGMVWWQWSDQPAVDERLAAAREAATKEAEADKGDNGGPILDEAAWQRASTEGSPA